MRTPAVIINGRIIIADDQPCHLGPVEAILSSAGYDVVTAANGREVLDKAAVFPPDLFLLDINMPELDGFETCSCLKDDPAFQDVPVIFMSAEDDIKAIDCAFELGGSDFLAKPFNRAEMLVRVRSHLRAYHARRKFRHEVMEEARQLGNVASLCVNLARTLVSQDEPGTGRAVPEVAGCLAGNAEVLARDIERLLGKDDAGFLRELSLRDFSRVTKASDVLAFLGGSYLRARRRGVSLTMPRRPDEFSLAAPPADIKRLLDALSDHFLARLPRGSTCHVSLNRREPGEVCVQFASNLQTDEEQESGADTSTPVPADADDALPQDLVSMAADLGADTEIFRRGPLSSQMRIVLPAHFEHRL